MTTPAPAPPIEDLILTVRGQRVILDRDLAALYGVATHRFPADFVFQLSAQEFAALRAAAAGTARAAGTAAVDGNSSQTAMSAARHRGAAYRPFAFTEHGALQAANILRSPRAVEMSVFVIRAFVKMREALLGTRELAGKLAELERELTGRLDNHEAAISKSSGRSWPCSTRPRPPSASILETARAARQERSRRRRRRMRQPAPPVHP